MHPLKTLTLMLTMLLALAAHAKAQVPLAEQAITNDTSLVVWIDVDAIQSAALRASAERINALLPAQMAASKDQLTQQLDESMADFDQMKQVFEESGGQGVLFVMQSPPAGAMGAQAPEPLMLVRVEEGTSAEAMTAALNEAKPADEEPIDLAPFAEGWLIAAEQADQAPAQASEAVATQFADIFAQSNEAPIRLAFRMSDALKQTAAEAQANPQQMGPFAALVGPAQDLEHGWATLEFGESPNITASLNFADAQAAQQFNAGWNSLLMMGQGMLSAQLGQTPDAPKAESVQSLFGSLAMQAEGSTLKLTLGDQFIQGVGDVAPAVAGPLMMMMMSNGGMGGPAGSQPAPAEHGPGDGHQH